MSPDFDEIVGNDESTTFGEREELRRVHELLLSASAAPPLPPALARPPRIGRRTPVPPLRTLVAVTATCAVTIAFGFGYRLGHVGGFQPGFTRAMHGTGALAAAHASLAVGKRDANGNRALEMSVRGLPPLPHQALYDLYLTKNGKLKVLCGTFRIGASTVTRVRMSVPEDLAEYTGWVVTTHRTGRPRQVLLTT
ncbi:MAG TPA: hypothetical protein VH063_20050 [Gaiellaceae bacterium]|nr:hypothetical protein [Gaiellaceae bacterium]